MVVRWFGSKTLADSVEKDFVFASGALCPSVAILTIPREIENVQDREVVRCCMSLLAAVELKRSLMQFTGFGCLLDLSQRKGVPRQTFTCQTIARVDVNRCCCSSVLRGDDCELLRRRKEGRFDQRA